MPDILQDLPIRVPPLRVFEAISQPAGLDAWWTIRSTGHPATGETYELDFGPGYLWRAIVSRCEPGVAFDLQMADADADWTGTVVAFDLTPSRSGTEVRFRHVGWPEANEHYRVSCHCWAMYLRLLRRYLEVGEIVPYERRLDV